MNCLILDDEPLAREVLETYVAQTPELNLLGSYEDPIIARPILQQGDVELLFLDIRMPGISGLELLKSLTNKPPTIITTAFPEHALEGFELDVIDYLVKPIPYPRFLQAVDKAQRRQSPVSDSDIHIMLKADKVLHRILHDDIYYAEAMGDYVKVFATSGRLVVKETLSALHKRLPDHFFRCHKSYLCNLHHIQQLEGNRVRLTEGEVAIGAAYKAAFMERLG